MKKVGSFFKNLIVIIMIFISILFINAFMILSSTSNLFKKETITSVLENMDYTKIIDENKKEEVYKELETIGLSKEEVIAIVENKEVTNMVNTYISEAMQSLIEEEKIPKVDEIKFTNDLDHLFEVALENIPGKNISEEEKKEAYKVMHAFVPEIVSEINEINEEINNTLDEYKEEMKEDLKDNEYMKTYHQIRQLYQMKYAFLLGVFLPLLVVIFLKKKDFKYLIWLGSTGIIYASSFLFIGFMLPYLWSNYIVKEIKEFSFLLEPIINILSKSYLKAGYICLGLGILFFVVKKGITIYEDRKLDKAF